MRKLFRIRGGEETKLLSFFCLGTFLQAGLIMGVSISDALFIVNVGADKLPAFFLLVPVIMCVFVLFFSWSIERFGLSKVFTYILLLLSVAGPALGLFSLKENIPVWFYYFSKLYAFLWLISLYSLYWNFVDEYFTILDAKRLYPILSGGLLFGSALGGGIVSYLGTKMPAGYFFFGWSFLSLVCILFLYRVLSSWPNLSEQERSGKENIGFFMPIRTIVQYAKKSKFVYIVNGSILVMIFIATVNEYQYSVTFAEGRSAEELTSFFGKLFLITNAVTLLFVFFGFSRAVARFGVSNIVVLQPIVYFLTFAYYLLDYGTSSALFGFMAYQGVMIAIDYNNWNFLFNAFPVNVRKVVRICTEGFMDPLATALAGFFLMLSVGVLSPQEISGIVLVIAGIFIVLALVLRAQYLPAMIASLREGSLDFSKKIDSFVASFTKKDVVLLSDAVTTNCSGTETFFHALWRYDRHSAFDAFLSALNNVAQERQVELKSILDFVLTESDASMNRKLLVWLNNQSGNVTLDLLEEFSSRGLIRHANFRSMLESDKLHEKSTAIVSLTRSWEVESMGLAMESLKRLLAGTEEEVIMGVRTLGKMKESRYVHLIRELLNSPSERICYEALVAANNMLDDRANYALPFLLEKLDTENVDIRSVTLDCLDKIQDSSSITPLLIASENFTPSEKRKVKDIILKMGLKSVPMTISAFTEDNYSYATSSLAARVLGELAFPQFESSYPEVIASELEKAYQTLYFHSILSMEKDKSPGLSVLADFYKKNHEVMLDFILRVLTIGGRLQGYELISNSLRSHNLKIRGDAIETLEQGVDRSTFRLLLPLVDMRSTTEQIDFYFKRMNAVKKHELTQFTVQNVIEKALESPFPLEVSIAAQAYWERLGEKEAFVQWLERYEKSNNRLLPKDMVFHLAEKDLARQGRLKGKEPGLSRVDKLYYMLQNPFLMTFGMEELSALSLICAEQDYKDTVIAKSGEVVDTLHLIIDGQIKSKSSKKGIKYEKGDLFGNEAVFSNQKHSDDIRVNRLHSLSFRKDAMLQVANTFPKISVAYLKKIGREL